MKNLLLFVSIAVSSSLGPYYFLKKYILLWAVPPLLGSFLIRATLKVFLLIGSGSGLLVSMPSYLLKQVKCRLSALGFKVLYCRDSKPLSTFISHSSPGCMSRLHMLLSPTLLSCFIIPGFQMPASQVC